MTDKQTDEGEKMEYLINFYTSGFIIFTCNIQEKKPQALCGPDLSNPTTNKKEQ